MAKAPPIITANMIKIALTAAKGSVRAAASALGMDRHKLALRIESAGLTEFVASLKTGNVEQPGEQPTAPTAPDAPEHQLPTAAEIAEQRKAALAAAKPRRVPPDPRIAHGSFNLENRVLTAKYAIVMLLSVLGLSACSHVVPQPVRLDFPIDFVCDAHALRCLA